MAFPVPSFDELLNAILTDYRNQFPEADISQGSLVFIKSACLASALWGLYQYQLWISKQIFPDTADTENLEHHVWVRGLSRTYGEADSALLVRLLEYIRRPPAGGNKYDYVKWAVAIDNVAAAYCFPIAQGLGTVDVIIVANQETTGSEIPSLSMRYGVTTSVLAGALVDSTANFTDASRPVSVGDVVRNTVKGEETTVTAVNSATQLTLAADIFKFVGENYHVHFHTGTTTSVTEGKLIDASAHFDDTTYTIRPGDIVENRDAVTETTVVSVDSATQVTLTEDIFTSTATNYVIRSLAGVVKEYIDTERPVTASLVRVIGPTILTQAVTMTGSGASWNATQTASDITAYMNSLEPGQTLALSQLIARAIENGADDVTVTLPTANVVPTAYQMIRPGVINVT